MPTPEEEYQETLEVFEAAKKETIAAIRSRAFIEASKLYTGWPGDTEIAKISIRNMALLLLPRMFELFERDWDKATSRFPTKVTGCPITLKDCLYN